MPRNADTADMVAARDSLLASGLYAPIRDQVATAVERYMPVAEQPIIADLAGGTGYYLAGILDRGPDALGLCLDISPAALKRAARSHDRVLAIGADLLRGIPLTDQSIAVAVSVFGPRNVPEIQRILMSDGVLVVITPTAEHLHEVIEPLGMVKVHGSKDERLEASLQEFEQIDARLLEYVAPISRDQAQALASMGPSAHHVTQVELAAKAAALPEELTVTVSVNVGVYRQ